MYQGLRISFDSGRIRHGHEGSVCVCAIGTLKKRLLRTAMEPIVLDIPLRGTHGLIVWEARAPRNVVAALAERVLAADAVGVARLHGRTDERLPRVHANYPDLLPRHSVWVQPHPLQTDVGCH